MLPMANINDQGEIRSLIVSESQPLCTAEGLEPLGRIATVGGRFQDGGFERDDHSAVFSIFYYLLESGLRLSPDFTITNYNLDPDYGGRDFLDPAGPDPADLVLFLMVFDSPAKDIPHFSSRLLNNECCVSPLHSREAFRKAAERTGAKMLGFRSRGSDESDEINETIVCPEKKERSPGEWRVLLSVQEIGISRDPFRISTYIPCSVAMRRDYLESLRTGGMKPVPDGAYRTLLHQRIAEYAPERIAEYAPG